MTAGYEKGEPEADQVHDPGMGKEVITIFRSRDHGSYSSSCYCSVDEFRTRCAQVRGEFEVYRAYAVDWRDSLPVITLCDEFVSGTLTTNNGDSMTDTLDDRIAMLDEEEGIGVERIS